MDESSLSTAEHDINYEVIKDTSLSGKELPSGWPKLATWEEHDKARGTAQGLEVVKQLSYELKNGDKSLLYLAVEHSKVSTHPQFDFIEQQFNQFAPNVVLYEGPWNPSVEEFREEAVSKYGGDPGFVRFLVKKHNESLSTGEAHIKVDSTDMPIEQVVQEIQKRGYSNEEILLNDVFSWVYLHANLIKQDKRLNSEEKTQRLVQEQQKLVEQLSRNYTDSRNPINFEKLPRSDGHEWTWQLVEEEIKRLTGQDFNLNLNGREFPRFRQIFDEIGEFRDQYVVRKITENCRNNNKVMVVMGSAHPVREKQALSEFFESNPHSIKYFEEK